MTLHLPNGVGFTKIGKSVVAVYRQHDGAIVPAALCKCTAHFSGGGNGQPMSVERAFDCPVDEHRVQAITQKADF